MAEQSGTTLFFQNPPNDTECPICRKAFSRLEHLKRHIATHTQEKPYTCQWCQRAFARKDAAQRHELAHDADGSPSASVVRTAVYPTCAECGQARVKCSGLDPCQNCQNAGLECRYTAGKKRRRALSDTEEQNGYAPSTSPEQAASEALAPEQRVPRTRSPLTATAAGVGFIPLAPSSSAKDVHTWPLQAFNVFSSNTPLKFRAESYPDEALISAIMDAPWTWTDADASCAEHVQNGQTTALAGRRYLMPNTNTSVGLPGSDINWLPLDNVSDVYFESISANALDSAITIPVLLGQGSRAVPPTSEIQETITTLPMLVPLQSSPKEAPSISQDTQHATLDEIEAAVVSKRKRSLYVDGAGSRSTHTERSQPRKSFSTTTSKPPSHGSPLSPNTPNNAFHEILEEQVQRLRRRTRVQLSITLQTYKEILFKLGNVFAWFSPKLHPFTSKRFPSIETLDWFVRLYFEEFHPLYPFLDRSLLSVPSWGSCMTLATAAIGANYMASPEGEICSDALHGLLHEVLTHEYDLQETEESLVYVQARALNVIGLCHSHQTRLMDLGYKSINVISAACSRLGLLDEIPHTNQSQSKDPEHAWIAWRVRESRRRTGLFVWMLDCILAYISNSSPHFSRSSLKLRLPSSEDVWDASTSQVWRDTKTRYPEPEYFQKALQVLYVERRLATQMSEFGSMVLIHGLIHRTWDVAKSFEDSLSLWTPGAMTDHQSSSRRGLIHKYLPSIPEFSSWRNSACDCLDELHWEALGASARADRLEGPIFLKLHLARSVLLTPVKELEGLVNAIGSRSRPSQLPHDRLPFYQSYDECYKIVRIWAERDKYKARLAVVHASATFWHVRRYSSDAFMQPFAVFLATIVLWAYSAFSQRRKQEEPHPMEAFENEQQQSQATACGTEDRQVIEGTNNAVEDHNAYPPSESRPVSPRIPEFMHLDRPFDDEIGQRFIRDGDRMKAFMEGVGDLCSENAPRLVLREGARILRNRCRTWTIAENYAAILDAAALNFQARML